MSTMPEIRDGFIGSNVHENVAPADLALDELAEPRARQNTLTRELDGESKPTRFVLTTMPRRMSKKQIVRIVKEPWRSERAYEELKGELGLDHFEGRSFPGWHHHVSVVLSCYAFIVAERVRRFFSSTGRQSDARSIAV
jgi:SRSO17 transposase